MNKFKWTIKHLQLLIIIGLVLGIVGARFDVLQYLPSAEAVTYTQSTVIEVGCDVNCEIEQRTQRIFEEKKNQYLEQARLDALVEMKDYIISQLDNSPYVDYQAMAEEYGYSE